MPTDGTITGLDIGTAATRCLVGRATDAGVEVLGSAERPSEGVFRGEIVDFDACAETLRACLEEAAAAAEAPIAAVFGAVPNAQCRGLNSRGCIPITRPEREVTSSDVVKVMRAAGNIALPNDRVALHKIRGTFAVDDHRGVVQPVGMGGSRLEAEVHVVTGAATSVENLRRCVERAGCRVEHLVAQALAAALASLTEAEREAGVIGINLGAGTTGCVLYAKDTLRFTRSLPVGGNHVTSDLAAGWGIPFGEAERIKREWGEVGEDGSDSVEAQGASGEALRLSLHRGRAVMRARVEETFEIVRRELAREGLEHVPASVVLSGQAALLHRVAARAAEVFGVPCRTATRCVLPGTKGAPDGPGWATAIGLALYGCERRAQGGAGEDGTGSAGLAGRLWAWLKDF
jgi:cell division protein FtsA